MENKKEAVSVFEIGLKLKKCGWSIIPIEKNKAPLIEWKEFQNRHASDDEIRSWFTKWPDANIAVVTGQISGVIVLDFDAKHNRHSGEFSIPLTICSQTGGGGEHVFFRYPDKQIPNSNGSLFGPGIDVKGDAGYAILPPSKHESGNFYEWRTLCSPWDISPADMPEWLDTAIFSKTASQEKQWQKNHADITEGKRNESAASVAGKILQAMPPELIETAGWGALIHWNNALSSPLSEKELRSVWESIKKYPHKENKEKTNKDSNWLLETLFAREDIQLFHDEKGEAYIALDINDHREILPCKSKAVKKLLAKIAWSHKKETLTSEKIKSILSVLEGKACYDGIVPITLHTRVAWNNKDLWYDLTNEKFQAVKITDVSWEVVNRPPILFRRYSHQKPQLIPESGGDVKIFLGYINIANEEHKLLFLVFLVACFVPEFPHAMLVIFGAQGSSKSTLFKLLRMLVDPSLLEVAALPKQAKELIQTLAHHHVLFFDNLSHISEESSDILCKAVTGSGFSKRELYENDEDIIYKIMRCIGINSINLVTTRADLLERSLLLELERIEPSNRKPESELYKNFEKDIPQILGGIFDTLVKAIKIEPTIELKELPRMADFARWGCAISEALGYSKEDFLKAYTNNIERQAEMILNDSLVGHVLMNFMKDKRKHRNTPTALLQELSNSSDVLYIEKQEKYWPKSAGALSRKLNDLSTYLKQQGFLVTISTSGYERWIEIINTNLEPEKTQGMLSDDTDDNSH